MKKNTLLPVRSEELRTGTELVLVKDFCLVREIFDTMCSYVTASMQNHKQQVSPLSLSQWRLVEVQRNFCVDVQHQVYVSNCKFSMHT